MKVYLSTDIEGVCGVTVVEEAVNTMNQYADAAKRMTREVNAACIGAKEAGASEIVVKDAHATATNIDPDGLIEEATLIRGWSGTPEFMMYGLDKSCDAAAFIGYHSAAALQGNPLAHTANSARIFKTTINGEMFSEFVWGMYIAGYYNVPCVLLTGDKKLCEQAERLLPGIATVAVKDGLGGATINMSPQKAEAQIKSKMKYILATDLTKLIPKLPEKFELDVTFKKAAEAIKVSYFPGAVLHDDYTVRFVSNDYYEVMRFFLFAVY
jgi:D-amino peptidase